MKYALGSVVSSCVVTNSCY